MTPSRRGFTLIEILLVLAVLSLLLVMLLPRFGEFLSRGKVQETRALALGLVGRIDASDDEKVELRDDFERTELRRGWTEAPEAGLVTRIVNGKVRIEGTATRDGEARVYREIAARDFVSFEASLEVGGENQAQFCGLFLSSEMAAAGKVIVNFRVDVARTRDGEVQYRIITNPREGPKAIPAPPGISWKTGTPVRISIERAGSVDDPRLRITVDGKPVYENALREFRGVSGMYKLGVFVQVEGAGRTADVSFDDVRLVYRKS